MSEKIHTRKPLKEFTVKLSKWRCGADLPSDPEDRNAEIDRMSETTKAATLGYGETSLLNSHGFKCCLGFAVKASGYRKSINGEGEPGGLEQVIPGLSVLNEDGHVVNSEFSDKAIDINDNSAMSVKEKIKELKALGKKHGIKVNFVP